MFHAHHNRKENCNILEKLISQCFTDLCINSFRNYGGKASTYFPELFSPLVVINGNCNKG